MSGDKHTMLIFVVPAFAGFVLLLAHLFRYRGFLNGLLLLAMVATIGFLKEHGNAVRPTQAEYQFNSIGPELFNVPVVVVVGWFYAVYIGWCLAEGILARSERWRGRMFAILSLALLVSLALSFCVETTGANMGWWTWHEENFTSHAVWFFNTPNFVLIGWAFFSLITLLSYFFIILPRFPIRIKIKWVVIFFLTVVALKILLRGIIFDWINLATMFSMIFILPFKNTWKLPPPLR